MLKKFMLKNYKNFKDEITIDFENIAGYQFNTDCLSDGIIGKMLIKLQIFEIIKSGIT